MENPLFSKLKGTKQNKTSFSLCPFYLLQIARKNITTSTFPYRHRLALQMGWLKHMPLTAADSNLRNSSNLTASRHVKLGCLGWMRSDFFQLYLSCYSFVFFGMATNGLIVHFSCLVTCCLYWVGSRLAPFQCRGSSLLSHSSFTMKENSFSIISATSFSMLGGFRQVQPICTHLDYPITF